MGKAILVIDMPNCCDECFALDDNGDYPFCLITQEQRGYTFRTREQKMDKCPFKLAPSSCVYSGHPFDQYGDGFADGYNTCLEEILGQ